MCGARASATQSAAATPVPLSIALWDKWCPSRCAQSTTQPCPRPGISASRFAVRAGPSVRSMRSLTRGCGPEPVIRSTVSALRPAAGMPLPGAAPQEPLTGRLPGQGLPIRNPTAPPCNAHWYLRRLCTVSLANMYSWRTNAIRPGNFSASRAKSRSPPRPISSTSAVRPSGGGAGERTSGTQGSRGWLLARISSDASSPRLQPA